MIHTHHVVFRREYQRASIIPKMPLIHLPQQLLNYGPGRYHWCMRFETKCICVTGQAENFLYSGDIVREGQAMTFSVEYPDLLTKLGEILAQLDIDIETVELYRSQCAHIHGHEYRKQSCLRLGYVDEVPRFGIVRDIVVYQELKIFVVEKTEVEYYDSHVIAYVLRLTNTHNLVCKWPLSAYTYKHRLISLPLPVNFCKFYYYFKYFLFLFCFYSFFGFQFFY